MESTWLKIKNSLKSKWFSRVVRIVIGLMIALLVFQLGMAVGFRKAKYSYGWGDNYERYFGAPRPGLMRDLAGKNFMNGHGIAGSIVSIDDKNITLKGLDNTERLITTDNRTIVIDGRTRLNVTDLQANNQITVIGRPGDDGKVTADIIRIFRLPPDLMNLPLPPVPNY